MSHVLLLTPGSVTKAVTGLRAPNVPVFQPLSLATIVNRQIKQVMQTLLYDLTADILEGLEHELRPRSSKQSWAASFCVILVLCTSIEMVQAAIDGYDITILHMDPAMSSSHTQIIRELDEGPFKTFLDQFHTVYKTHRQADDQFEALDFNPIRDGLVITENEGITQQMVDLVSDINQIWKENGKYLCRIETKANFSRI